VYCCGNITAALPFVPNPGLCLAFSCVDIRMVLPESPNELNKSGTWTSPWVLYAREAEVYAGGFSSPKVAATTGGFTMPEKDYSGARAWRHCESIGSLGDPCVFLDPASFKVDGQVCSGTFAMQDGANGNPKLFGTFELAKSTDPTQPTPTRPPRQPSVAPTRGQPSTTTTTTATTTTTNPATNVEVDEDEADDNPAADSGTTVIVIVVSVIGALIVVCLLGVILLAWKSRADDSAAEPSAYDVVPHQSESAYDKAPVVEVEAAVGTTYDDASALE
jgi:hypothetical protein